MPRRGRPRKSIEVKDQASDDDSDIIVPPGGSSSDEDPLIATRTTKSKAQPTKKILEAVAIPSTTPATSAGPRRRVPSSQTPSSMDSVPSTTRDHSMEYDTPATSAAATPAEVSMKTKSVLQLSKSNISSLHQSRTSTVMSSGKRKRVRDFDADARLAEALQAEEYDDQQAKPAKRRRPALIKDSDDDDSALSDLAREASIDADMDFNSKKTKPTGRTSLPSRSARDSAKKTISAAASLGIEDTEEDSMSEFSELESDDFEDSDEDNEEVFPATDAAVPALDANATDPNQATAVPAARRRRRRRMPDSDAATRVANMNRRRIEGLNYRVSRAG